MSKQAYKYIGFFAIFLTPIRSLVVPLMPFFSRWEKTHFRLRVPSIAKLIAGIYVCVSAFGVINGTVPIENALLALWIIVPLLLIQFAPSRLLITSKQFSQILKWYNIVLIVVDVLGLLFYIKTGGGDEFGTAYGRHFQYVSGLAMMNTFPIVYYLIKILELKQRERKDIYYLAFFFTSFILCLFGLGCICLALAIGIYILFKINIKSIIYVIIGVLLVGYLLVKNNSTLEYNLMNIEFAIDAMHNNPAQADNARKVTMFYNYYRFVEEEPLQAIIGVGGGGFNSRIATLLNDESDNLFTSFLGHHMPEFYVKYIYPLWNFRVTSFEEYTDGTRNKPFSSLVGLLAEGGLIFFCIYMYLWIRQIITYFKRRKEHYFFPFLFCLNLLWLFSMASEVWMESSEFLMFIITNHLFLSHYRWLVTSEKSK